MPREFATRERYPLSMNESWRRAVDETLAHFPWVPREWFDRISAREFPARFVWRARFCVTAVVVLVTVPARHAAGLEVSEFSDRMWSQTYARALDGSARDEDIGLAEFLFRNAMREMQRRPVDDGMDRLDFRAWWVRLSEDREQKQRDPEWRRRDFEYSMESLRSLDAARLP